MASSPLKSFPSILLLCMITNSFAIDVLRINQTIQDGGDTIVSTKGEFEMGFFSPGNSTNRYFGIWFKKISHGTIAWVANRETPLNNTSGILRVDNMGLKLFANTSNIMIWSSNSSTYVNNAVAQLLDTGNLVFREEEDGGSENIVWQSFDYPGDALLPGMKSGKNLVTGRLWYHSPWKSADDPSEGSFVHRLDTHGYPQFLVWKGTEIHARFGPWVGNRFSGDPVPTANRIYLNEFFLKETEIYFSFHLLDRKSITPATKLTISPTGNVQRLVWNHQNQEWTTYLTPLMSDCDKYGLCGPYSTCDTNSSPRCICLQGFSPNIPEKWEAADWTDGCVRETPLDCGHGDGFVKHRGVKLPDTRKSWYNVSINLEECKSICLKNCTCTAYSSTDIRNGGSGCLLWFEELMDIKGSADKSKRSKVRRTLFILIPVVITVIPALILLYLDTFGYILFSFVRKIELRCRGKFRVTMFRLQENCLRHQQLLPQ